MNFTANRLVELYCFYEKIFLKAVFFVFCFSLIFLVPVFSAEDDYYMCFDQVHKLAAKIYQTDIQFNTSYDELFTRENQLLGKCEPFRFNYFDKNGHNHIVYGNPNSLVKPHCFEISYKENDTTSCISNNLTDSSLVSAIAFAIYESNVLKERFEKQKIDLTPYVINSSDTFNIFYIASWQFSGKILNASEFHYTYYYDRKTNKVNRMATDSIIIEPRMYESGADEIILQYKNSAVPTVGSLLFSMIYHELFNRIRIETKNKSTYLMNLSDGSYVHLDNK